MKWQKILVEIDYVEDLFRFPILWIDLDHVINTHNLLALLFGRISIEGEISF